MPTTTAPHAPGTFCWIELASADAEAAKRFYPALFGWTVREVPIPGGTYLMCQLDGHDVAAMYQMGKEEVERGIPAHWFPYIAVASADDAVTRAGSLGATIETPAFDVAEHGRMAVIQDPTGAHFGVWQAKQHVGVQVRDEPNALCWNEVMTPDRPKAAAFYSTLFGYLTAPMPMPAGEYTVFMRGETAAGGCMQITPEMGPLPAGWLTYFAVTDCDAATRRATSLGATVVAGPEDAPGVGRWAMLQDPQGAIFSVIALHQG
jgi:predicted enzyme related to lactoylglutathione lyase